MNIQISKNNYPTDFTGDWTAIDKELIGQRGDCSEQTKRNKANLRDFIAATGLVTLFGLCDLEIDQSHRCGHRQAACREPAGSYDKTTRTAVCFEHKTQYLLTRAPYTRIMVFWHISKIPPTIGQSQISYNTPTFCIPTIFVKYCYTTGSWLL